MALSEIFFFFIVFFFLLLSLQPSTSAELCRVSCGGQWIRFPFRLNNQPDRCGYPRFNLSCRNQTETILTLPFGGAFRVEDIDYLFQTIWISDPDSCTPRRLLKGLNFSGTLFEPLYLRTYMFLNCSLGTSIKRPEVSYISCLSGETFSVVAIPAKHLDTYPTLWSCLKIATVLVPASDPNDGVKLTWNEPNCMSCESRAGSCMFKSDTGLDIGCSGGFRTGLTNTAKMVIMFGVGIPFLCILGLVFYLQRKANVYNHRQQQLNQEISSSIGPPRRLPASAKGLDRPTIEAYPITLLGESGRFPRPNDNTCPICLCEYQAKEALRTIPDCKHYFHASCIDEWLKLNASCPLCRSIADGCASS
ncbi:hypothetical protein DITRI_Ditri04bG0140300 [Diplodiscus trichospermus]